MLKHRYIVKFKDKAGKILGYRLRDESGNEQNIASEQLKHLIKTKQIYVNNLQLSRDGRLIDIIQPPVGVKVQIIDNTNIFPVVPKIETSNTLTHDDLCKEIQKQIKIFAKNTGGTVGTLLSEKTPDGINFLCKVHNITILKDTYMVKIEIFYHRNVRYIMVSTLKQICRARYEAVAHIKETINTQLYSMDTVQKLSSILSNTLNSMK